MLQQLFLISCILNSLPMVGSSIAADVKSKAADQSALSKHPYDMVQDLIVRFVPDAKTFEMGWSFDDWLKNTLPKELDNLLSQFVLTPLERYLVIGLVIKYFDKDFFPGVMRSQFTSTEIQKIVDAQRGVQNIGYQSNLAAAILMAPRAVYNFVADKIARDIEAKPESINVALEVSLIKDLIPIVQKYAIEKPLGLSIAQIKADRRARYMLEFESLLSEQSNSWNLEYCMIVDCDGLTPDTPIEALHLRGNPLERLSVAFLPDTLQWLDISDCPQLRFDDIGAQGQRVTKPNVTTLHAKNNGYTGEEITRIRSIFPNLRKIELGMNAQLSQKNRDARK